MSNPLVIDADGHCYEPDNDLAKWMPKELASQAPNRVSDSSGYNHLMIEGRLSSRRRWGGGTDRGEVFASHIERSRPGMTDPLKRLPDMDEEGIDVAIIFGTSIALSVNGMANKPLAAAICHAVNRWLAEEYLVPDPKRLKGVGLIPVQDPQLAMKELEYIAQQKAVVSAMLPTNVYGINLGHRMFDPVYAAAQEMNIPLSVHPQTEHDGQYGVWGVMGAGSERMEKYSYVHMTSFPFELMIALMHMIGEGVFDRYPKLKVGFMEGACGWLPFWSERMDEHFYKLRPQWPLCKRKPSEIVRSGQVSFTCEPEETILPYVLDDIGITQVMYASDYRHWDSEFPDSVKQVKKIPGMTDDKLRHVLGENARKWFNLSDDELPVR
ncbi:MAG: amidohydrolase [Deltaproteobacteria bacterium]|nr:amidohydrolase [Deltaproteobacteria bacterium]